MSARWFPYRSARRDARLRLFCFPHAGAGASVYRGWDEHLPASIELCAVQLPGRETRFQEPLCRSMSSLLALLEPEIMPLLDRPFALFGYSAGAIVAYTLARQLQKRAMRAPVQLFVAACAAPQLADNSELHSSLPDPEFARCVLRLNGFVPAIADNTEFISLMTPVVRADLQIIESHKPPDDGALSCPISAFAGSRDREAPPALSERWADLTSGSFELDVFEGDHFFIRNNKVALIRKVSRRLAGRGFGSAKAEPAVTVAV